MSTRVDVGQSAGVQERPVTSLRRRTTTYGEIVMALPVELRDKLVFNRIVGLKDTWAKIAGTSD